LENPNKISPGLQCVGAGRTAQCTNLVEGVYTYYVHAKGGNVQAVIPVTVAVYNSVWRASNGQTASIVDIAVCWNVKTFFLETRFSQFNFAKLNIGMKRKE
jgi:hypothetical protein